jgi:hypothetical protein
MNLEISAGHSSFPRKRESRSPSASAVSLDRRFRGVTSKTLILHTSFQDGLLDFFWTGPSGPSSRNSGILKVKSCPSFANGTWRRAGSRRAHAPLALKIVMVIMGAASAEVACCGRFLFKPPVSVRPLEITRLTSVRRKTSSATGMEGKGA